MPEYEDDPYLIDKYGGRDSEEDRGQIVPSTSRSKQPAWEKQASRTSAVLSGGATEADIKRNHDWNRGNLARDKHGVHQEHHKSEPTFPATGRTQLTAGWERSGSPKVEGSTNDPHYFKREMVPQRSSISPEEGSPGNKGKGKAKVKGKGKA